MDQFRGWFINYWEKMRIWETRYSECLTGNSVFIEGHLSKSMHALTIYFIIQFCRLRYTNIYVYYLYTIHCVYVYRIGRKKNVNILGKVSFNQTKKNIFFEAI